MNKRCRLLAVAILLGTGAAGCGDDEARRPIAWKFAVIDDRISPPVAKIQYQSSEAEGDEDSFVRVVRAATRRGDRGTLLISLYTRDRPQAPTELDPWRDACVEVEVPRGVEAEDLRDGLRPAAPVDRGRRHQLERLMEAECPLVGP